VRSAALKLVAGAIQDATEGDVLTWFDGKAAARPLDKSCGPKRQRLALPRFAAGWQLVRSFLKERSSNVIENKVAYPIKPGMSRKIKELSPVARHGD
jgi:hypothetical protein